MKYILIITFHNMKSRGGQEKTRTWRVLVGLGVTLQEVVQQVSTKMLWRGLHIPAHLLACLRAILPEIACQHRRRQKRFQHRIRQIRFFKNALGAH